MRVIGITGRSGCGKSTISDWLRQQGYPIVDTDQVARDIMEPGSPCLAQLAEQFGPQILRPDGTLRRRHLANLAFATEEGTRALTSITHPEILRRTLARRDAACAAGAELFFLDGAVLVNSMFQPYCDTMVVVTAPFETSVERICRRDGISAEMAARRLNAQLDEAILREHADFVLENDQTPEHLVQLTRALLDQLRKETHA